jgi:dipeptidase E
LGVLELTALPSIKEEYWIAAVQEADALLVQGGDVWYLCRWMRESGLADLLPSLRETVYVGVSAGSMVTAPVFGETYNDPKAPFVIDAGLGLVDFALLPHLDHEDHPESSTAKVGRMAAEVPVPTYAIDDQTAIKVTDDGTIEVVSEGHWKLFPA